MVGTAVRRWWPVPRAVPALHHRGDRGDLWREWRIAALALLGTALGVALRL